MKCFCTKKQLILNDSQSRLGKTFCIEQNYILFFLQNLCIIVDYQIMNTYISIRKFVKKNANT